jgi:predicted GNAT family N-acyltransferase
MNLQPKLLTDKSRLQEIYDLRVDVWENSEKSEFVNRQLFPNGWFDDLDDNAYHWVIENDENKIVAAARLNIFDHLTEFPYHQFLKDISLPQTNPFGFYSRLVIHPEYQGLGLSIRLITSRMHFCEEKKIFWLQGLATNDRIKNLFEKLNFQIVGQAEVNYHEFTTPHLVNVFIKEYHYDI